MISVLEIRAVLDQLLRKSKIERPILGISYVDLAHTPQLGSVAGGVTSGALITSLAINTTGPVLNTQNPAVLAGLRLNDIVVSINSDIVNDHVSLSEYLLKLDPGDKVELGVLRRGEPITITATLISSSPDTK